MREEEGEGRDGCGREGREAESGRGKHMIGWTAEWGGEKEKEGERVKSISATSNKIL